MTLPLSVVVSEDGGDALPPITNTRVKADGVELRLTDLTGWTDTADVRANPSDLVAGDGSYDDGPLFASRTVIVKGVALADSPGQLLQVERKFRLMLVRAIRQGFVDVTQSDGPTVVEALRAMVRVGGTTTFQKTLPTRAEFSMSLFAADPRRYSLTPRTGFTSPFAPSGGLSFPWTFPLTFGAGGTTGQIAVFNGGDIPTGVRLEINGACLNPQVALIETGERLALIDAITDGVVIDTNTRVRSVLRNGAPYGFVLTSDSEFFQLPVGNSTLLFSVDAGTPTLTATWSDATP